jgi:DNA-3-methyladenine glycosylase II
MHSADGRLIPTPPFDFALSLRFLEGFSPAEGEQAIEDAAVTKGLRTHGQTVVFRVAAADGATPEAPELSYQLWSEQSLADGARMEAADRIGAFLSIDDDLVGFYERAGTDPVFAPVAARLHGLHQVRFLTPFENLCWAVMGQRAPIAVARRAKDAFVERYGGALEVDGVLHRAFPEPADVAGLGAADLLPTIGNRRRADYLANVIEAWQDVDETWLRTGPVDDVQAWLRSIKGVGKWSTAFVLFRGLGRHAPMPLTVPTLKAIRQTYGAHVSEPEAAALEDRYAPWTGYWVMYQRAAVIPFLDDASVSRGTLGGSGPR